ncbi:MAG TPA: hypothetical protein VMA95_04695 [Streptosporangiaceae bacterium]|nr:hypothetical protein [Streptosporangiaceae bacterium]
MTEPALIVHGPGNVRFERREPLVPGPGEVVVRPELALGHEWTGIVAGDSALAGRRVVLAEPAAVVFQALGQAGRHG